MATKMVRQTRFTTGEVDIVNWKRTDIELYMTAAQRLLNMEVGTTGLAKKRKGTKFVLDVTPYVTPNSKMFEFVDKNGNYYIILLSAGTAYIFADNEGIPYNVVTMGGNFVITGRGNYVVAGDQGMSLIQTITGLPYTDFDISDIDYSFSTDNLFLTNPLYPPARIFVSNYATNPVTFAYQVLNIQPYPAIDLGTVNYNNATVAISGDTNTVTFVLSNLPAGEVFTSAWVGGIVIGGGATVTSPLGYGSITAVSQSGTTATFTLQVQIPFNLTNPSLIGNQYSVRQPSWSDALGWPAVVMFYQNRLWLANTKTLPTTVFGSEINDPVNFDVGVGLDTDAIVYTIGQNNSGNILWMNGGKQMEIYCQNSEFAAPQETNVALSPNSFSIRQQASYGASSFLKPVTYINDSYYSTRTGQAIINFHFNGIGLTYIASNVSVASEHLVANPVRAMLIQGSDSSQDNFIYFLNKAGDVISFQFASEYKLAALTPIDFNTNPLNEVTIKDILTVNNRLYFLKLYENDGNGRTVIEVFDDSFRMDSCIGAGMNPPPAMSELSLISGLDELNGYYGDITFDNQDYGQTLDVNGNPAPITGGTAYVFNPNGSFGHVTVGLIYNVMLTPMYVFAGAEGADLYKQITRIYVDYYNSLDFEINGVTVPYQNFVRIQDGVPLGPLTDTAIFPAVSGWNRFYTFNITQESPFDLQITAIAYQIDAKIV